MTLLCIVNKENYGKSMEARKCMLHFMYFKALVKLFYILVLISFSSLMYNTTFYNIH
jgi:hypothetical protein